MRASHLLVKYEGSRRQASWRDPDGAVISKRTEAEAQSLLEAYIGQLQDLAGADLANKFATLASTESDCGSAQNGGDLGEFASGAMMKPFEDCVLALEVGAMSGIVKTDSGLHIILRTG